MRPKRTCTIEGCPLPVKARDRCAKHYQQWKRATPTEDRPPCPSSNFEASFWAKVDKDGPIPEYRPDLGPCWIWTSSLNRTGYGQACVVLVDPVRRNRPAHRVAYELEIGPIPAGLQLDHLCRVHACVNPGHLEPVTIQENLRRGREARRDGEYKTHCKWGHPFAGDNLKIKPDGSRVCLQCVWDTNRRNYQRKLATEQTR